VPSRLELKVPPLLVLFIMAGAMLGVTYAAPALSFRVPGRTAVALALAALGAGAAIAGVIAFRGQHTTVNPLTPSASSAIVTGGIYRVSRNPMYLGFLLGLAGWAAYLSNAGAALFLPAFVAYLTRYQIKPEERALLAKFGSQYAEYMSRVRRWI
jgi:protein-S-isoprenylcysteine O-methyltransferase Ste14